MPLGLVERKQQPRRRQSEDISPETGMQAYQLTQEVIAKTYQHNEFLDEVIGGINTKGKSIAIIGEPGAGKTTISEKIGEYLVERDSLPIYIPASNLSKKTTLKQYLLKNWLKTPITESQLEELLHQRVWLLLDGVDEMACSSPIEVLSKQLAEFRQARVVLTCRLNVWDANTKNLLDFQTYKTQEFSLEQVQTFILAWFQCASTAEQGQHLWEKLNEQGGERLQDTVKNPLRLALLCQSWCVMKGELPKTKAALYERFTRYHYEWKAEFPAKAEQDELNKALGELAREAIASDKTRFRIAQKFANQEMGEKLFNRACRLGWLNQVDRNLETDEPFYAFYHATFQEYFAALAIDDWGFFLPRDHKDKPVKDADNKNKPYRIFEPQWKEVILLWLGREDVEKEQKEEFIEALVKFRDGCGGFYQHRAYFFAAAGVAEFEECSRSDEVVAQIVQWSSNYGLLLDGARAALQQTHRAKAIDALVNLIATKDNYYTRMLALPSLGEIAVGNEGAIDALIDFIANSQNDYTRRQAAQSLGQIAIGNESAIEALVNLSTTSQDEFIRRTAAYSLGEIAVGNEGAIAALVNLIAPSEDESTPLLAVESLGKIAVGNESAIAALVNLIASLQPVFIRWQAAESLGKIAVGNESAIAALEKLIPISQDESTRWLAAYSLGQIAVGNEGAMIAALEKLIAIFEDEDSRCQAAESLGQIDPGNESAIAALIKLIAPSEDESTRQQAAQSLGQIAVGNKSAIAALIKLIAPSEDESTRRQAVESLGKIAFDNESAIAALINLITRLQPKFILKNEAYSLWARVVGEERAFDSLNFMSIIENKFTYTQAVESLKNILPADKMAKVIIALRYNFKPDEERDEGIWSCLQNVSYSTFYEAWHYRPGIKIASRFALFRLALYSWQRALFLFLWLSIYNLVFDFIVAPNVKSPTEIQQQQQIR